MNVSPRSCGYLIVTFGAQSVDWTIHLRIPLLSDALLMGNIAPQYKVPQGVHAVHLLEM